MSPSQSPLPKRHPTFPDYAFPPLDASMTLTDIYAWHSTNSAKHPLFVFEDSPGNTRTILWGETIHGLNRAALQCTDAVGLEKLNNPSGEQPVVAILASLDTITYTFLMLGIMRAGAVCFPISPRNSPAAVAHLLSKTNCHNIFVSPDRAMQDLIAASTSLISESFDLAIHATPVFDDFLPSAAENLKERSFNAPKRLPHDPCVIYHSSGTTAFPKPIYFNNNAFTQFAASLMASEVDFCGKVFAVHALPLSHGMGMFPVMFASASGSINAVFKPRSPPTVPTPRNQIEAIKAMKTDMVLSSPTFLEEWSRSKNDIDVLKTMDYVIYGGGPLAQEAGDLLVSEGVSVVAGYGATECLLLNHFLPKGVGKDWDYFSFHPDRKIHLIEVAENEYTFAVLCSGDFKPNVIDTNIDGVDGCLIKDILQPHPTRSGLWKVIGRVDDQIMHSTGEKTNPGPLEKILMGDPHIGGAVMFGRSRFNVGVLVSPKEKYAFDPSDEKKLADFRALIWPTVEKMNEYAPQHSRLFKEMIIVTSPNKPLLYTGKGTIRRQACITEYEKEIRAAYDAVAESSQAYIDPPPTWDLEDTMDFVRRVITHVMGGASGGEKVKEDTELFQVGLDSLQATWIRNTILQALREDYPNVVRGLSPNIVFEHPTIKSLAQVLSTAVTGSVNGTTEGIEQKRQRVIAFLDKYTQNIPKRVDSAPYDASAKKVVLLTGGTGSLGSNILARLLDRDDVSKVYALSRTSTAGSTSKDRHAQTFEKEHGSASFLDDSKVEFFDGDPAIDHFGLSKETFGRVQTEVTHIIHNGWRVNFVNSISSFESNIRGVRNLAEFAVASPKSTMPRIVFVGSIGVLRNWNRKGFAPEKPLSVPDTALDSGYAESKWVSERILQRFASETSLSATSVRCGQMTGGRTGTWNEHEWFPSIVKSSVAFGMFPLAEGDISWVTGYDAGGVIVDILDAKEEVLHLAHPRPVPWNDVASAFAKTLNIPLVPYQKWLGALERRFAETGSDPAEVEKAFAEVPALRLIDFFRGAKEDPELEPLGMCRLATEKAQAASKVLREAEQIGSKDVEKWVAFWKKSGFLHI